MEHRFFVNNAKDYFMKGDSNEKKHNYNSACSLYCFM